MYEHRIRPGDTYLMNAETEYCYIYCDINYSDMTAIVTVTCFTLDERTDKTLYDVKEADVHMLVGRMQAEGWQHLHTEHGREYQGFYLQRLLQKT